MTQLDYKSIPDLQIFEISKSWAQMSTAESARLNCLRIGRNCEPNWSRTQLGPKLSSSAWWRRHASHGFEETIPKRTSTPLGHLNPESKVGKAASAMIWPHAQFLGVLTLDRLKLPAKRSTLLKHVENKVFPLATSTNMCATLHNRSKLLKIYATWPRNEAAATCSWSAFGQQKKQATSGVLEGVRGD